jgi:alpha-tubulin suppressor-like RCC1 family protein
VTQSGDLFRWGAAILIGDEAGSLQPIIVEGFGEVRVRRAGYCKENAYAIGEDEEFFWWGRAGCARFDLGNWQDQPSPKRVGVLRGIRVSDLGIGWGHALALGKDGLVYTWGESYGRTVLGHPHVERELLPKPVEALRGVRVSSIIAAGLGSYAVADIGELWAWGCDFEFYAPLGHGEEKSCSVPKPIALLHGIKMDAVAATLDHMTSAASVQRQRVQVQMQTDDRRQTLVGVFADFAFACLLLLLLAARRSGCARVCMGGLI